MKNATQELRVLGIESSCDDTGVAIVNQDGQILSNCINSQLKKHLAHGGIIPVLAKEYHLQNIDHVARQAFEQSGLRSVGADVDAVAVSTRPGLQFSLQVGLNYARTLAKKYSKPLIPIHHMQAHALMPTLQNSSIRFPFLCLLISGGHCIIAIAKRFNNFQVLGNTTDEAPGDLLDKFARRFRLRNLGPPFDSLSGGAAVELLSKRDGADKFRYFNTELCVPMIRKQNCDFSFSGYRGTYETLAPMFDELWLTGSRDKLLAELSDACASLQRAILIQLAKKLQRAIMFYRMHWRYSNQDAFAATGRTNAHHHHHHLNYRLHRIDDDPGEAPLDVLVSGGVAANGYLIDGIRLFCNESFGESVRVYAPAKGLCSDNGLMVAWNGMLHLKDFLEARQQQQQAAGSFAADELSASAAAAAGVHKSVVCATADQMDLVDVEAQCSMGQQIGNQVELARFKIERLRHSEFKLKTKC